MKKIKGVWIICIWFLMIGFAANYKENVVQGKESDQGTTATEAATENKNNSTQSSTEVTEMVSWKENTTQVPQNTMTATTEESRNQSLTPVASISYRIYQNNKWQKEKKNGKTAGNTNYEGMTKYKITINSNITGGIAYQTLSRGQWSGKKSSGKATKKVLQVEAVKISLTGALKKKFDVYYRVRVETTGWLGWTKNGKSAGTANYERGITGMEIKLVSKSNKIETSDEPSFLDCNKLVVKVNRKTDCTTVYQGKKPIKAFICSTGGKTPLGTYYAGVKYRWRALFHNCYGQYITQITGNILFHSVPYDSMDINDLQTEEYNKLGTPASMGCIRMRVCDTKWIYDNCPTGTKIVIYESTKNSKLGKPKLKKIPLTQNYDPTDPEI